MTINSHIVVASKDVEADLQFFLDMLEAPSVDAGRGYTAFSLPAAEASIHETEGGVSKDDPYLPCDDIASFATRMAEMHVECGDVHDEGWGQVVELTLPSGAPFHVYEPRHRLIDPIIAEARSSAERNFQVDSRPRFRSGLCIIP